MHIKRLVKMASKNNMMFYLAITVICVIASICAVISSLMGVKLGESAEYLYKTQYQTDNSAWRMKLAIKEMDTRISQFLVFGDSSSINHLIGSLDSLNGDVNAALNDLRVYYDGPIDTFATLASELSVLKSLQREFIELGNEFDLEQMTEFYTDKLNSQYQNVDNATNEIKSYVEQSVSDVVARDKSTAIFAVAISLFLGFFLVAVAVLFSRNVTKRNRDIYFRDMLFNMVSDNINDMFFIFNPNNKEIEYVSANIEKLFGVSADGFRKDIESVLKKIGDEHNTELVEIYNGKKTYKVIEKEYKYINPKNSGTDSTYLTRVHPIIENGEVTRYIIITYDKTEERRTRDVIRDALISAQNANDAKRDFLSRMSHEIRTPMNAIIGMSAIAAASMENPKKVVDCLNKISLSSKHLLVLINDVLDMSKIESGKMNLSQEPFSLPEFLNSITSIIYPAANAKNVTFEMTALGITSETVIGDQLRLNQILLNLLSNAIKFTPAGGNVSIEIRQSKRYYMQNKVRIVFEISDTGIGMSEDFLKKQFSPFEQEDSTIAQRYGGTGLGMSITKNLVNLMHGSLDIKSELGKGSVFTVGLDFILPDDAIGEEGSRERETLFSDLSVLVVDNDIGTCEHAETLLNNMGIAVEWVTSGFEAIDRVRNRQVTGDCYDVCFIDWKMPEISGLETARKIREIVGSEMLVIIISAYDWTSIERDAREAGINAFIPKPMFPSTLYNALIANVRNDKIKSMAMRQEQPIEAEEKTYEFGGKRVLIAEDNDINMVIAQELLEMAGLTTDCAINGREAFERFVASEQGYYSAILMDVQMPIMDGYEATKAIRRSTHPDGFSVPIIAMTANAFNDDIKAALDAGMNEHVAKPINVDTLYKTLDKCINFRMKI